MDRNRGHITIIARDGEDPVKILLYGKNDLWFHAKTHTTSDEVSHETPLDPAVLTDGNLSNLEPYVFCQPCANHLLNMAQWELWHQRLAHSGTTIMGKLHKDADGVPKLCGNAFFRCPSCMSNKLCTKPSSQHKNLGACMRKANTAKDNGSSDTAEVNRTSSELDTDDGEWGEFLDDLHLPEALPGQHFHINFGFVRGSEF